MPRVDLSQKSTRLVSCIKGKALPMEGFRTSFHLKTGSHYCNVFNINYLIN